MISALLPFGGFKTGSPNMEMPEYNARAHAIHAKQTALQSVSTLGQDASFATASLLASVSLVALNDGTVIEGFKDNKERRAGLRHALDLVFPVDSITQALGALSRTPKASTNTTLRDQKRELWGKLKVNSLGKTISALYATTLLACLLHVQLSVLGRLAYVREDVPFFLGMNSPSGDGISAETERQFLSLASHFLTLGWKELTQHVQRIFQKQLQNESLRQQMDWGAFRAFFEGIRGEVEAGQNFASFLLPPDMTSLSSGTDYLSTEQITPDMKPQQLLDRCTTTTLPRLTAEVHDLIESTDFGKVLSSCFQDSFTVFYGHMQTHFLLDPSSSVSSDLEGLDTSTSSPSPPGPRLSKMIALAALLPTIHKHTATVLSPTPNPYLSVLEDNPALRAFSTIVYTAWDERLF